MNLFEQYGIKEVADVTIYEIVTNSAGKIEEVPYLYLDSLKVSTIEQTAEQAEARGGKGNPPLIIWDYGKEINITLEDALYSPKSMALMFGGGAAWQTTETIEKALPVICETATVPSTVTFYDPQSKKNITVGTSETAPAGVNSASYVQVTDLKFYTATATGTADVATSASAGDQLIAKWTHPVDGFSLTIQADSFPGTYKLVGDTYARNRETGQDEYFQFIIPRAKMSAEETLTLEAEGDPTTFNLNMRVLRPKDEPMMQLIQYSLGE